MKLASMTFLCDVSRCNARCTVTEEYDTAAYLSLVDEGWKVSRRLTGWKHLCPDHETGDLK